MSEGAVRVCVCLTALLVGCATSTKPTPNRPSLGDGGACELPRPLHYRLVAALDPEHRRLRATASLQISCLPRDELTVLLNPNFFLEGALVDGRRVSAEETRSNLPEALAATAYRLRYRGSSQSEATLDFRYEGKLRRTGSPLNELSSDLVELNRLSSWYPRLIGRHAFTAELSIYAPLRFRFVASGRAAPTLSVTGSDGEAVREWSWSADQSSADLMIVGAPHLRSLEIVGHGEKVISYYSTLPSQRVEAITASVAHAGVYLREALAPSADPRETVLVFVPRSGSGYRSARVNVVSEESVRTSSRTTDLLILGLSGAWWGVSEEPAEPGGVEAGIAHYYGERAGARVSPPPAARATVALLREVEERAGRAPVDLALGELRERDRERPLRASVLESALREAFGDVLIDAVERSLSAHPEAPAEHERGERHEHETQ